MAEFKKHGANLNIKNIVIHQVLKDAGKKKARSNPGAGVLQATEKERIFLGKLHKSYHSKSNPIYGIFAGEDTRFKDYLENYVKDSNVDFYNFSLQALDLYKRILDTITTASGGFMILCEYHNTTTSSDLLLVLMINNKEGYMVNEKSLTLEDIKNLDLNKVDLACLIDLTEWQLIETGKATERITYLSFTKGKKNVSNYFLNFIDCDNKNTHSESTNRLLVALEAFAQEKNIPSNEKIKRKEQIHDYCTQCSKQGKEVSLSSISALIYPEDVDLFTTFASSDAYRVSSIISVDNSKMRSLKYIRYKSDELTLEFDSDLIANKIITIDSKDRLIIKDVPKDLKNKIIALQSNAE
jgi:nucleoid-associated protein YejK